MENKKNISKNNKNISNTKNTKLKFKETFVMKLFVFLGVIVFCIVIVYLAYHFFVRNSDILINMSTDKQMEYINIKGKEELIMTQKYVSDLEYSMRYDINSFRVFKYKKRDVFKNLNDERVLLSVEKSTIPSNCLKSNIDTEYNNCLIKVDNYTEEYYISSNSEVYKLTIKNPGTSEYTEADKAKINYMLNSFVMN